LIRLAARLPREVMQTRFGRSQAAHASGGDSRDPLRCRHGHIVFRGRVTGHGTTASTCGKARRSSCMRIVPHANPPGARLRRSWGCTAGMRPVA